MMEIDQHYDGRPVLGHVDKEENGTTVRYFYHIMPQGTRWMLGKYVSIGNGCGMTYRLVSEDDDRLIWSYEGPLTLNAATMMFKDDNDMYVHEEGEQR